MSSERVRSLKFTLATKFGWLFILLLGKAARLRVLGYHNWVEATSSGKGVLVTIWHGRILMPIYMHRYQGIIPMVSLHDDGEMIARTVNRLGYPTIRGSSTRGGRNAFHQMLRQLRRGAICTIMPDGPKGPRHQLKEGTVHLASRSGAYILPLTFSAKSCIEARSWDKFLIWKPFARVVAMYGEPITIPRDLTEGETEQYRLKVQSRLIQLEEKADAFIGK